MWQVYRKTLCAEDASRFLQFRNHNERKGLFLGESLLRLDGVSQESVNAKLWTVLSGIAKSAPVNLLGYVVAEQDKHPAENRPGKWTWQELALFMAIAVSVFPDLFREIEKVEALRWLSSVRDVTSLSNEEQDSFLDSLGHRFDMDTTSEEWREQKAISRRIVAAETIHELPAGSVPFETGLN